MAKIWVKGYTKPDGTKVRGHYREAPKAQGAAKVNVARNEKNRVSSWAIPSRKTPGDKLMKVRRKQK